MSDDWVDAKEEKARADAAEAEVVRFRAEVQRLRAHIPFFGGPHILYPMVNCTCGLIEWDEHNLACPLRVQGAESTESPNP